MFYKVVLNGSASGQDIKNILYYRTGFGVDLSVFGMGGAQQLAERVKADVWSKMKAMVCNQYQLETIDVSPINEEFTLVYQMPYSLAVGEVGNLAGASYGPATCLNFKFQLEPTTIQNGIKPPRRGYVAIGPIPASYVGEDGFTDLLAIPEGALNDLCATLAQNLEVLLPAPMVWYPIRLKQSRILGGLVHWESYADIKGCVLSRRASLRRSRLPEL